MQLPLGRRHVAQVDPELLCPIPNYTKSYEEGLRFIHVDLPGLTEEELLEEEQGAIARLAVDRFPIHVHWLETRCLHVRDELQRRAVASGQTTRQTGGGSETAFANRIRSAGNSVTLPSGLRLELPARRGQRHGR